MAGRWLRRLMIGVLGLAGLSAAALLVLDSPLGHRLVADRLAAATLPGGLLLHVGRIEGSLFTVSQWHDVVLSDPAGRFMTVPEARLDWRPIPALRLLTGFGGGIDIRDLTLHHGVLWRVPRFTPGEPDAPMLPQYAVRVDRLRLDALSVVPGIAGARRRVDLEARALVRDGRITLDCDTRLGGRDTLVLHLDSAPDHDRFALNLDYRAPKAGLLAALTGVRRDIAVRAGGAGRFAQWHGWVLADADGQRLARAEIDRAGAAYRLAMLVHPAVASGGLIAALGTDRLEMTFAGSFAAGRIDGRYHAANALARIDGTGVIDLAHNRAEALALTLRLVRPDLLPAAWRAAAQPGTATLVARFDGRFADLAVKHDLTLTRLSLGTVRLEGLHTAGVARWRGGRLDAPVAATVARVSSGAGWLDQCLTGARLTGALRLDHGALSGDGWHVAARGLAANLALRGDLRRGSLALAGRVDGHGLVVPGVGVVDAQAKAVLATGSGVPWSLAMNYAGTVGQFAYTGLTTLAGDRARVAGSLHVGAHRPLRFADIRVTAPRLSLTADGSYGADERLVLALAGQHTVYGAFAAQGTFGAGFTHAEAQLPSPLPAAGLTGVALVIDDAVGGYHLNCSGNSMAGRIAASVDFAVPPPGDTRSPARMTLSDVRVGDTRLTGVVSFAASGLAGDIRLAGGGLDGSIHLAGRDDGQAVMAMIAAHGVRLAGDRLITIGTGRLSANLLLAPGKSSVAVGLQAQGVALGGLFIGQLTADGALVNGAGTVTAALTGRRGTRFALNGSAAIAPDRVAISLAGDYAGTAIAMPRRAVLTHSGDGWKLAPSEVNFGSGVVIASGSAGVALTELHLAVSRMPLSALDIVYADLGLGGFASGVIDYRNDHDGAPHGRAALTIAGLTRSGLVLTSRPLDLAVVAALDERALQVRALAREGTQPRLRLEALVADLPRGGALLARLRAGTVQGHLRFAGPADALWRLAAIDAFDLTGPVGVAADITGSLDQPVVTGAVVSHDLRAQSAVSGSDVQTIDVVGSFTGARLALARFAGTTAGGGRIVGSGTIDFSDVSNERPRIDVRLAATQAALLNRPEMAATITGPLRIVSDGHAGTIAGRLHLDRARWQLGRASAAQSLPLLAVTERNAPADAAPPPLRGPPWKLLIDAAGANRIDVRGLGLDSEWQADLRVRGDTANPQIFGSADVVRGSYDFAGKRFDLTRGRIRFTGEQPINPQLDIIATGDANDISATISISGSAQRPQISFSSVPSLPEEELVSRILFGSSIAQISAPEAVQLAAALAALRGGSGLDPINRLRGAIGLDRLRVLSADPTISRSTALAVGKYLGRKFYVELVTDGHGYSASSIEFRLTRWLSLLGTVSTLYDQSISLKVSKDY